MKRVRGTNFLFMMNKVKAPTDISRAHAILYLWTECSTAHILRWLKAKLRLLRVETARFQIGQKATARFHQRKFYPSKKCTVERKLLCPGQGPSPSQGHGLEHAFTRTQITTIWLKIVMTPKPVYKTYRERTILLERKVQHKTVGEGTDRGEALAVPLLMTVSKLLQSRVVQK